MVLDTDAISAKNVLGGTASSHPRIKLFGQEIVMDLPIQALILSALGGFVAIRFLLSWLTLLVECFAFRGIGLKTFGAKKGKWAVVTGPTSGIGHSFAHQLAKKGFNLLLVGRKVEVLKQLEGEIATKYGVETKIAVIDFGTPGPEQDAAFEKLRHQVQSLSLGVLVNNAGQGHDMPVTFAETSEEEISSILQVNVLATLRITHVLLPNLLSSSPSLILNIGSLAATSPSPLLATYSGSKAFLTTWTKALAEEVKSRGVVVQMVLPGFVVSKMSKLKHATAMVPSADDFVRSTLSSIGLARGALGRPYESTPYWTHAMLDFGMHCLPESWVLWYNHRLHKDIRRRVLRKREREASAKKDQ